MGLARATHAMGKARLSAWARPPPVELHLWTHNLARLFHFFTDFIFIRFPPTLCNGTSLWIPKPILHFGSGLSVWKARLGLENSDCKNSQEVEFSSEKMKLIVLIGAGVGEVRGVENSQELQFLYDYNQLRFSFCFITLGKTERADLPRPHHLTHLQVIEPASRIIFF